MIRLLVTSGRGPAECRIAVRHVIDVIAREAKALGCDCDIAPASVDTHGPASAIVILDGAGADALAKSWSGSVLWTSRSPVRPHHKRKNWYVGVSVLAAIAERGDREVSASDVRFEAFRAGGPGGQHQNKTESAVRAVHLPTGLSVVVRDGRSQHRNRALGVERLGALLAGLSQIQAMAQRAAEHAGHDQLERGNPVRRFAGERFEAA